MCGSSRGPVATRPGYRTKASVNDICDVCSRPATVCIQGETDSFGCEYLYYCGDHTPPVKPVQYQAGVCDWCGTDSDDLRPCRDLDEGSFGPFYDVCGECVKAQSHRWQEDNCGD